MFTTRRSLSTLASVFLLPTRALNTCALLDLECCCSTINNWSHFWRGWKPKAEGERTWVYCFSIVWFGTALSLSTWNSLQGPLTTLQNIRQISPRVLHHFFILRQSRRFQSGTSSRTTLLLICCPNSLCFGRWSYSGNPNPPTQSNRCFPTAHFCSSSARGIRMRIGKKKWISARSVFCLAGIVLQSSVSAHLLLSVKLQLRLPKIQLTFVCQERRFETMQFSWFVAGGESDVETHTKSRTRPCVRRR